MEKETKNERLKEILRRDFFIARIPANFDGSEIAWDIVIKELPPYESSYKTIGKYGGLSISGGIKVFKPNEIKLQIEKTIKQLRKCKFKDKIGHPLENNIEFINLEKLVN